TADGALTGDGPFVARSGRGHDVPGAPEGVRTRRRPPAIPPRMDTRTTSRLQGRGHRLLSPRAGDVGQRDPYLPGDLFPGDLDSHCSGNQRGNGAVAPISA